MSSYFDKAALEVDALRDLPDDEFIEQVKHIENRVAKECLLCAGDREFPDDLRQDIVATISLLTLGYHDMKPIERSVEFAKSLRQSLLISRLHDKFHNVATRRIQTRFGTLNDNPGNILYRRDNHDQEGSQA